MNISFARITVGFSLVIIGILSSLSRPVNNACTGFGVTGMAINCPANTDCTALIGCTRDVISVFGTNAMICRCGATSSGDPTCCFLYQRGTVSDPGVYGATGNCREQSSSCPAGTYCCKIGLGTKESNFMALCQSSPCTP